MGGETQRVKKPKKATGFDEKKTTKNPLEIQGGFCYNNSKALCNETCFGYVIVNVVVRKQPRRRVDIIAYSDRKVNPYFRPGAFLLKRLYFRRRIYRPFKRKPQVFSPLTRGGLGGTRTTKLKKGAKRLYRAKQTAPERSPGGQRYTKTDLYKIHCFVWVAFVLCRGGYSDKTLIL